jgi:hypothetical protein
MLEREYTDLHFEEGDARFAQRDTGLLDTVFFICKILAGLMQMLLEIVYAF